MKQILPIINKWRINLGNKVMKLTRRDPKVKKKRTCRVNRASTIILKQGSHH